MQLRQSIQSVLGLFFLVTSSFALSNTQFTYISNDNSVEILGCENICPLNLVIPNEIDGLPVTKIGWAAFSNNHLTSVFIPNSVTTIANLAFDNNNLTSVVIPESIETIGWLAFSNNNLQAVSLPAGIERLEDGVFYSNKLTDILIPNNVTFIGVDTFKDNEINDITLSNNLILISSGAFAGNNITNLTIPSSVISIHERAFFHNPLKSVTFLGDRPNIAKDTFALVEEKDDSFWNTPQQGQCVYEEWGEGTCGYNSFSFVNIESELVTNYCINNDSWPGEPLFVSEQPYESFINFDSNLDNVSHEYLTVCTTGIPADCFSTWAREISTPQLINDCPVNNSAATNPVVNYSVFDLDQNGSFEALTDALILLRYAFGLRGDNLINGAIATDANRTTAEDIEAHIQSLLP
jgi:hypothetical protein